MINSDYGIDVLQEVTPSHCYRRSGRKLASRVVCLIPCYHNANFYKLDTYESGRRGRLEGALPFSCKDKCVLLRTSQPPSLGINNLLDPYQTVLLRNVELESVRSSIKSELKP